MTVAVLASPSPPPPDPSGHPGWSRLESTWTDWRGQVWDLNDTNSGPFLLQEGVRGLGHTPVTHYRDRSPAVSGAYWRGASFDPREVFWPMYLFSDVSSLEYVKRDRSWWRGLDPLHEGIWKVRVPDTGERWIKLRLSGDDNWAPTLDPTFYGWATYGIPLQADRPFWHGAPVTASWGGGEERDFRDGATDVVYISSGNTLGGGTVANPGDVDAWGVWEIEGPFTSISLTVAGGTITLPVARGAGKKVVIDTNPDQNTVIDSDGVDLFDAGLVPVYDPLPIPPVDEAGLVPVGITVAGTSAATRVRLSFDPLYHRAW